jgi:hypothetical protein
MGSCLALNKKEKNRSSTHVMDTWAVTGRSHFEADVWTASTWRPPNPSNPALPFATGRPSAPPPGRHRSPQIPNSFPPTEPSCDDGGRSVPFPPSVPPPQVSPDAETSPFPVIRALPLTAVAPCSALLQTSRLGRAPLRPAAAPSPVPSPGPPRPWGLLKRAHVLPPFTRFSLLVA